MPILRAGPFVATNSSILSFFSESDGGSAIPINCNFHTSANWGWRCRTSETDSSNTFASAVDGVYSDEDSFTGFDPSVVVLCLFGYQAKQSWVFPEGSEAFCQVDFGFESIEIFEVDLADYSETVVESVSQDNSAGMTPSTGITLNLNTSYTFPATVVPRVFGVRAQGTGDGGQSAEAYLTINLEEV